MKRISNFPAERGQTFFALPVSFLLTVFLFLSGFAPPDFHTAPPKLLMPSENQAVLSLEVPLSTEGNVAVLPTAAWQSSHSVCTIAWTLSSDRKEVHVSLQIGSECQTGPGEDIAHIQVSDPETGTEDSFILQTDGGGVLVIVADV